MIGWVVMELYTTHCDRSEANTIYLTNPEDSEQRGIQNMVYP